MTYYIYHYDKSVTSTTDVAQMCIIIPQLNFEWYLACRIQFVYAKMKEIGRNKNIPSLVVYERNLAYDRREFGKKN